MSFSLAEFEACMASLKLKDAVVQIADSDNYYPSSSASIGSVDPKFSSESAGREQCVNPTQQRKRKRHEDSKSTDKLIENKTEVCEVSRGVKNELELPAQKWQRIDSATSVGSSSKQADGGERVKRMRTSFSAEQLIKLEEEFNKNRYISGPTRMTMATDLNLSERQITVWFQNRRMELKKEDNGSQNEAFSDHSDAVLSNYSMQHKSPPTDEQVSSTQSDQLELNDALIYYTYDEFLNAVLKNELSLTY